MLICTGLLSKLLLEALSTACYIINRLFTKALQKKRYLKLGIKENLISQTYKYMIVMHILLSRKLRPKRKWYLAHEPALLLAMKPRINREFGMIPGFYLGERSSLMSQSFELRMRQALNQWGKTPLLTL